MRFLFFIFSMFICSFAQASENCEVSLNYGVVVTNDKIRVLGEGGRTVYQVNQPAQLFVKGNWIDLDQKQESELAELSSGIHIVVPKMVLLANEGVELAIDTIEQVYAGLVKDDESQKELQKSLEHVQMSVKEKFIRSNDSFYMGPGKLEQVNDLVDKQLEEQIEAVISTSVGGVLSAIGGLVTSDQDTEEKMEIIVKQLESIGDEMSQDVVPKADRLKLKAKWFCHKFKELDKLENNLRDSIWALQEYDVLTTGDGIHQH